MPQGALPVRLPHQPARRALHNLLIAQIAATLYAASIFCDHDSTRDRHAELLGKLREAVDSARPLFPCDGSLGGYFDFVFKMVDIWLPSRA